ncbi:MAG: glutamate 5-kinase, partial [Verrucomicrobiota bacterium]
VINENDSVATFELRFGDNDKLSVQVARLIQADQLMLFTSVPGLRRPDSEDPQDIVSEVHDIREVLSYADASSGPRSVGGMRSKLEAVSTALDCGIPTLIADGHHPEQLSDLLAGKGVATRFFPRSDDR